MLKHLQSSSAWLVWIVCVQEYQVCGHQWVLHHRQVQVYHQALYMLLHSENQLQWSSTWWESYRCSPCFRPFKLFYLNTCTCFFLEWPVVNKWFGGVTVRTIKRSWVWLPVWSLSSCYNLDGSLYRQVTHLGIEPTPKSTQPFIPPG